MATLYLNNHGSKWIETNDEYMKCILIHKAKGYRKVRKIKYWESFGNFAAAVIPYKGKLVSCLPDETDKETGYPICYVDHKEKGDK